MSLPLLLTVAALAASPAPREFPAARGLWQIESTFAMKGLPVAPPPRTSERCVSEKDAEDPGRWLASIGWREDACGVEGWDVRGKTIRWTASCTGRYEGSGDGLLVFDGDRCTGEFTIEVRDARGDTHPVTYKLRGTRRGACPP